jgi:hypothetical protein
LASGARAPPRRRRQGAVDDLRSFPIGDVQPRWFADVRAGAIGEQQLAPASREQSWNEHDGVQLVIEKTAAFPIVSRIFINV